MKKVIVFFISLIVITVSIAGIAYAWQYQSTPGTLDGYSVRADYYDGYSVGPCAGRTFWGGPKGSNCNTYVRARHYYYVGSVKSNLDASSSDDTGHLATVETGTIAAVAAGGRTNHSVIHNANYWTYEWNPGDN